MKKNGFRYCKLCNKKMVKNGTYSNGKQRWYCNKCNKSSSNKRVDIKQKLWLKKKVDYFLGVKRQSDFGVHRATFFRNTRFLLKDTLFIPSTGEVHDVIYIDGIRVRDKIYLIARSNKYVIGYMLTHYETFEAWSKFISNFPQPKYVVCDGQNGMIKAIKTHWNDTCIQRCLFHVFLNVKAKLTTRPETLCGQELFNISKKLLNIFSRKECDDWIKQCFAWHNKYQNFLSEKSKNETSEWFTHERVRSAGLQLKKLIYSNNLFHYLNEVNFKINRTNNPLEGGINSPIRRLINSHRGMKFENQQKIIELYLLKEVSDGAKYHTFSQHSSYFRLFVKQNPKLPPQIDDIIISFIEFYTYVFI